MFEGLKFFGCTVKSFATSLGWSSQPSNVRISLVRDVTGGDVFVPTTVGLPVTVEYGSLHFTGLVRDYKQNASDQGFPTYEVNIEDPRSILEGTELILKDYNGSTYSTPNLLNIYGSYESTGFGNSLVNESGMPWYQIANGVSTLVNFGVTTYGGPLSYKGILYGIDLSQMPLVPSYYRIPGSSISLLRAIEQVCKDSSCEFFVDFIPGTTIIRVRTVNLRLPPSLSKLSAFIDAETLSGNCITSSKGIEMRNEPTSAFITGGLQSTIIECFNKFQYFGQNILNQPIVMRSVPTSTLATTATAQAGDTTTITFAAGASAVDEFYINKTIVITSGTGAGQTRYITHYDGLTKVAEIDVAFDPPPDNTSVYKIYQLVDPLGLVADLNCSEVADILGTNIYTCYLTEMLCVLYDTTQWDSYVQKNRPALAAVFQGWRLPLNQQVGSLPGAQFPLDVLNLSAENIQEIGANTASNVGKWKRDRIYEWLLSTVNNHLGKTYLVPIPSLLDTVEPDTLRVIHSHEPTNAGWLGDVAPQIPPEKRDLVTTEDGRIQCYCEFLATQNVVARGTIGFVTDHVILGVNDSTVDDAYAGFLAKVITGPFAGQVRTISSYIASTKTATVSPAFAGVTEGQIIIYAPVSNLDLTKINNRSAVILSGQSVFVKCQVEQGKVINLTGFVNADDSEQINCALVTLSDAVFTVPTSAFGPDLNVISEIFGHLPENLQGVARRGAGGKINWCVATPPANPFRFYVPIQSNTLTYGPWYAIGAQGKVSFKSDSSLVPWNYGSNQAMDLTAQAMVNDAISWANAIESGEVQLVGAPRLNLGDAVQTIGPVCTGMDVKYAQDGVATTYRFQTFSPKFGLFSFSNVERIKSLGLANQRISREIRTILTQNRNPESGKNNQAAFACRTWLDRTGFWRGHSPHPILIADSQRDIRDSSLRRVETALTSIGEVAQAWAADQDGDNSEFTSKASVSLSALFRPFSTRLVGVNGAGAGINLPDGIASYDLMQMPSYWSATAQANYTYAMGVKSTAALCLDPFSDGNDIELLLKSSTYTDAHNSLTGSTGQNDQRVVCLKGPIVISSWGYCTDDSPVPAANPDTLTGGFVSSYKQKSHLWKTGPLEILWDDERGVWTPGGIMMGKTKSLCAANGGTCEIDLYENATTIITNRKKNRTVFNFMSSSIAINTKVICGFDFNRKMWVIMSADCS